MRNAILKGLMDGFILASALVFVLWVCPTDESELIGMFVVFGVFFTLTPDRFRK